MVVVERVCEGTKINYIFRAFMRKDIFVEVRLDLGIMSF